MKLRSMSSPFRQDRGQPPAPSSPSSLHLPYLLLASSGPDHLYRALLMEMGSSSSGTMKLGLTESIKAQVQRKFAQARAGGDLLFSDTELSILRSKHGIPVGGSSSLKHQLRFLPSSSNSVTVLPSPQSRRRKCQTGRNQSQK